MPGISIRMVGPDDAALLRRVAPGVFDNEIDERRTDEFLRDSRHHLAVAIDERTVVGMASALHYVHPDKAPQLWITEVGVAPTHWGRRIGRRLLEALLARARTLGCTEAWVLTDDRENEAAHALYASVGGVPTPDCSVTMYTISLTPAPSAGGRA